MLPTRMSIDRPQCRIEKRARERNADGSRGRLTTTTTTTSLLHPTTRPYSIQSTGRAQVSVQCVRASQNTRRAQTTRRHQRLRRKVRENR